MSLPGKALHVAVRLWFGAGLGSTRTLAVSMTSLQEAGVSRFAAARGLHALERAGLVSVERHVGRKPIVTLLGTPVRPVDVDARHDDERREP